MNCLIFKKLQIQMKQWWFRYAIRQLLENQLFYDYFFLLILQLINELLGTAPSKLYLHVLHSGIAGHRMNPGNVVCWRICYLFIWHEGNVL